MFASLLVLAPIAAAADLTLLEVVAGRTSHGTVAGVVEGQLDALADTAADCRGYAAWFPDLYDTRVVARTADAVRCAGRSDLPWPMADRTWVIEVRRTVGAGATVVSFGLVSGDLARLDGRYRLEDLGAGRVAVTYDAYVDLGAWFSPPAPLVEWATRRVLPAVLDGLERRSAGDGLAEAP